MSVRPLDWPQFDLAARLFAPLAALRRRARLYLALDGWVRLAAALIVAASVQLLLDRWLRFSVDQRAALNVVITLIWLWIVYRYLVRPLARPLPDVQLATALDRAHPHLHDQLATAVQFAHGQVGDAASNSTVLVQAVLREAGQGAAQLPFLDVLDHRRAARRAAELAGLLLLILGAFTLPLISDIVRVWFQRNWLLADIPWPQQTTIVPVGYDREDRRRVPRNDELEVVADVYGEMPTATTLIWRTNSGQRGRESMTRVGDRRLVASVGVVTEDVHFRIVGGDERTREYTAEAVERPRIVRTRTTIAPPEYAALAPTNIEQETVFEVLSGSYVEIEAWLNKPIVRAEFVDNDAPLAACELTGPAQVRVRLLAHAVSLAPEATSQPSSAPVAPSPEEAGLPLLTSGSFRFELFDADGWNDRRPVRFTIKVTPDGPPTVSMELTGVGEAVTPEAELRTRLKFEDAYGLRSVELVADKNDGGGRRTELSGFAPGERRFEAETLFAVATLTAKPGERLRLWGEATDNDPRGPNVGRSPSVELRVLSPEDFMIEISQRELELRREFERLISEQRVLSDGLERLLPATPEATPQPGLPQRLAGLSRQQNTHARRCVAIATQFEQILGEMRTSKVAKAVDERRIRDRVSQPLVELATRNMPAAAEAILAAKDGVDAERRGALVAAQAEILQKMRVILAQMLEWEGYQEAVSMLREIIDDQAQVQSATRSAIEQQLEAILGLDLPPDSPNPESKP